MCIVKTSAGKIRGKAIENGYAFLGIPYAAPPVGELRWKLPQPPVPWTGIRDCLAFGPCCLQAANQCIPGGDPADRGTLSNQSEDCLYANVWTPGCDSKKRPVFIWIHGGAYCCGSGAGKAGDPTTFLRRDIVYVSFNYRVGILGFFAHPELSEENEHHVSGNYGHYDQFALLRWVRDNISAFGGDPDNITVGGCSAGSGSTQVLAASPLTKGMIRRIINECGLSLASAKYPERDILHTLREMEQRGTEFMKLAGCKNISEMRAMPYEKLAALPESSFRKKYHYGTTMGTNEDGYLIPVLHSLANETLQTADIPRLAGNANDEGHGHMMFFDPEYFIRSSEAVFGDKSAQYFALAPVTDKASVKRIAGETHLALAGAKAFAAVSAAHHRQPVYLFDFCRKNPSTGAATHSLETQYLFGHQRTTLKGTDETDDAIANLLQEYWCNFIRTGNPNGDGLPAWTPYTPDNRCVLYIDAETRCLPDETAAKKLNIFARDFLESKMEEEIKQLHK